MSSFGYFVITAWAPVALSFFSKLDPRKAIVTTLILGWLFLPIFTQKVPGLPDVSKTMLISLAAFLGVFFFATKDLINFKFSACDLLPIAWIICPYFSSTQNGLGSYSGMSAALGQFIAWGIPYFLGRVYFSELSSQRLLAIGILLGGLIYIPFCLYEIRMSPQLHLMFYGFFPHSFIQTYRYGGWRPQVFMQHGLMLGMWMTSASLMGIWFYKRKMLKGSYASFAILALVVTTILCKSTLSILLLIFGTALLFLTVKCQSKALIIVAALIPIFYIGLRSTGTWSAQELVSYSEALVGERRADSVATRIKSESLLLEYIHKRPLFGRGRGNHAPSDRKILTDGRWIIVFGAYGWVGLFTVYFTIFLSVLKFCSNYPVSEWKHPLVAPSAALTILIIIYSIDSLFNAFINPLIITAIGGLLGQSREWEVDEEYA